jgi:NAD(P)-dependent dehydrogenase (short-subunit alcohol dehydrogenase family)
MTGRLAGKVCLVMGAGSSGPGWGNGKAAAVLYAREGGKIACVDRETAAAEETAAIIRAEGGAAIALSADVIRDADVVAAIATTLAQWGRIDVLHNNVGVATMGGPVELSEEAWRRTIDVNVTSLFLACKHVLPIMLAQSKGAIVNVSSLAGMRYTGYPYIAYYASKGAVNQFTVGLALQHAAQGIRVNAVMPGLVDTPLMHQQIGGQYKSTAEMVAARDALSPTGKMGTAVNGVCLPVDGGLHAKVG